MGESWDKLVLAGDFVATMAHMESYIHQIEMLNPPEELEELFALDIRTGKELLQMLRDTGLMEQLQAAVDAAKEGDLDRMLELVEEAGIQEGEMALDEIMTRWQADFSQVWSKLSPEAQALLDTYGCGVAELTPPLWDESDQATGPAPASPGLGVSRSELEEVFSQPEWGFSFWHVPGGGEHQPRSVGEIEGKDAVDLLLIGPPEDLSEVRTIVELDAPLDVGLYLVELLASVLPTWTGSGEWLADATDSLVAGVDREETYHGPAVVSLELLARDVWPMLDLVITTEER